MASYIIWTKSGFKSILVAFLVKTKVGASCVIVLAHLIVDPAACLGNPGIHCRRVGSATNAPRNYSSLEPRVASSHLACQWTSTVALTSVNLSLPSCAHEGGVELEKLSKSSFPQTLLASL